MSVITPLPKSDLQSLPVSQTVTDSGDVIFEYDDGPEDKDTEKVVLEFVEEPCGLTAKQGFGYLQVEFGERIGPENRYEILRKLGWGMFASVWLAKDTVNNCFVAIKALHGCATENYKDGKICELDVLRHISSSNNRINGTHCLSLLDTFMHPGKDEDGEHLCLVTEPLGPSIDVFRNAVGRFRLPIIRKILQDILIGLDHIHSLGIAHTDLRPGNVMADLRGSMPPFDIQSFIENCPAERHPPELTWGDKYTRVAVSQPFPIPPYAQWMSLPFILADFGSAQFIDKKVNDYITPLDLRAPEIILNLPWDEKVDIWTFGCLVFAFINDQKLFKPSREGFDPDELMIWQILSYTGDRLPAETIRSSQAAVHYLNPETGWLASNLPPLDTDIPRILKKIGSLRKDDDIDGCSTLLRKCLRLDPKDRLSAKEILQDPWLNVTA